MLDGYEDAADGRPYALCTSETACPQGKFVDHMSASLVNREFPALYPRRTEGFVLTPRIPFLCAYPGDAQTGVSKNGGCPDGWDQAQLGSVLAHQPHGGFNEIIIPRGPFESLGAAAIEAFLYCGDDPSKALEMLSAFRREYATDPAARDVPLLRVRPVVGTWSKFVVSAFEDVTPPWP